VRVLLLARVDPQDNQDELAIKYALEVLGHEVVAVHESPRRRMVSLESVQADLCLFMKHKTVSEIIGLSHRMPCCFYFFDMVESVSGDPTLLARSEHRKRWFADVLPHVVAGFCTDGDWAAKDKTGKLVHLTQGFDERNAHLASEAKPVDFCPEVVFCGMVNHGQTRASHIAHLERRWGRRFGVVGDSGPNGRLHGKALADLFAGAKVVIAPDGPGTHKYQSNRVYLSLGLGAFLLHPYSGVIASQYEPQKELAFYKDRDGCDELIRHYLKWPDERARLRKAGHEATLARNLYRHRIAELLRVVKERI
jgi:hypothetical protein